MNTNDFKKILERESLTKKEFEKTTDMQAIKLYEKFTKQKDLIPIEVHKNGEVERALFTSFFDEKSEDEESYDVIRHGQKEKKLSDATWLTDKLTTCYIQKIGVIAGSSIKNYILASLDEEGFID